jgi:hypothetical protein
VFGCSSARGEQGERDQGESTKYEV